jgi:hypothetical protein
MQIHLEILVIIPIEVYKQGFLAIKAYVTKTLEKYDEDFQVEPYIVKTVDKIKEEYEECKNDYVLSEEYINNYNFDYNYTYRFDDEGNVISTVNKNSLYDHYTIGDIIYFDKSNLEKTIDKNCISIEKFIELYNTKKQLFNSKKRNFSLIFNSQGILYRESSEKNWKEMFLEILNGEITNYVIYIYANTHT